MDKPLTQELFWLSIFLATTGTIVSIHFLAFNIFYRKHRLIKMSSPHLNAVTCTGSMLSNSCCLIYGLQVYTQYHSFAATLLCQIRAWFLVCSFTLILVPILAKCWRVNQIFKKAAFKRVENLTSRSNMNASSVINVPRCCCEFEYIWMSLLFIYKGSVLSFGLYVAWQIRNITLPSMDDAKPMILIILTVFILCSSSIALWHLFREKPVVVNSGLTVIIWLFALFTQSAIFIPKILLWRKNKSDKLDSPAAVTAVKRLTYCKREPNYEELCHLVVENSALKRSMQAKELLIHSLQQHLATATGKLMQISSEDGGKHSGEIDSSSSIRCCHDKISGNIPTEEGTESAENLNEYNKELPRGMLDIFIRQPSVGDITDKWTKEEQCQDTNFRNGQASYKVSPVSKKLSYLRDSIANDLTQAHDLSSTLKDSISKDLNISHTENSWVQDSIPFQKNDIAGSITQSYDLSDDSDTYSYVSSYIPTWTPTLTFNQQKHYVKKDCATSPENIITLANDKLYPAVNSKIPRHRTKRKKQCKTSKKDKQKTVYTIQASQSPSKYFDESKDTLEEMNNHDIMV
ncbi:probable G-protein coupled receptor 156 isoform X2 [Octopus sinensis]|uniref:Probable G-protein coupled receptor 156 isoform X2 n=1 Tax=Octopus sinensis TaxID=2607531 RepID=A0A7E6EVE9_9MOLL|nr:probable G-protein coupled receptor 156 isoform X2 [Octopus sinensis]